MMNKQTKTLLGVALLAGVGVYLYKQSKLNPKAGFANFSAPGDGTYVVKCLGHTGTFKSKSGNTYYRCCKKGYYSDTSDGGACAEAL